MGGWAVYSWCPSAAVGVMRSNYKIIRHFLLLHHVRPPLTYGHCHQQAAHLRRRTVDNVLYILPYNIHLLYTV